MHPTTTITPRPGVSFTFLGAADGRRVLAWALNLMVPACPECRGTGSAAAAVRAGERRQSCMDHDCPTCSGLGYRRISGPSPFGPSD